MAAATVTERLEIPDPNIEVVRLEASDGETYVSRRLAAITGAHISLNTDTDGDVNVTFSGQTATLNMVGVTDNVATLTLHGRM